MDLVVGGNVCKPYHLAIVGISFFPVDEIVEEKIVNDGEVGVTFEVRFY